MNLLTIADLKLRLQSDDEWKPVLKGISFVLQKGEILGTDILDKLLASYLFIKSHTHIKAPSLRLAKGKSLKKVLRLLFFKELRYNLKRFFKPKLLQKRNDNFYHN